MLLLASPKFHVQLLIVPAGIVELFVNATEPVLQSATDVKFGTGNGFTFMDLLMVLVQPELAVTTKDTV